MRHPVVTSSSPQQVAPATPPQGSPPRLSLVNSGGHDPSSNLAAAFRMALPGVHALPSTNGVGLVPNSYVLPLLESNVGPCSFVLPSTLPVQYSFDLPLAFAPAYLVT